MSYGNFLLLMESSHFYVYYIKYSLHKLYNDRFLKDI